MGYTTRTKIPCKGIRGLMAYSGFNINCTLVPGTGSIMPIIEITNYQEVAAGSNIFIYLPNVNNPNGLWTLRVSLVTKQNRLYSIISQASVAYTTSVAYTAGIVTTVPFSGTFYSFTKTSVSEAFNLNHKVSTADTFDPETRFLFRFPKYDIGYVPEEGHVTCRFDDVAFNCYQFQGIDWVYGQFADDQTLQLKPQPPLIMIDSNLYISNIRWPRYRNTVSITAKF